VGPSVRKLCARGNDAQVTYVSVCVYVCVCVRACVLSVREAGCGSAAAGVSNANTGRGAGAHRCARASRRNAGAGRSNAGPRRANAGDVHLESELRGGEGEAG
jgi:hypothetical protein